MRLDRALLDQKAIQLHRELGSTREVAVVLAVPMTQVERALEHRA